VPLGDELGDLLGRRATSRRCQPVPRLGVDRIRDVDDDLASEPIGVLLDGLLDAGVVDGEDDYLAAERSRGVDDARGVAKLVGERPRLGRVAVEDFYVVAARDGARADAAPHVPGADDRDLHGCLLHKLERSRASRDRTSRSFFTRRALSPGRLTPAARDALPSASHFLPLGFDRFQ
jgi:hypothetical protein